KIRKKQNKSTRSGNTPVSNGNNGRDMDHGKTKKSHHGSVSCHDFADADCVCLAHGDSQRKSRENTGAHGRGSAALPCACKQRQQRGPEPENESKGYGCLLDGRRDGYRKPCTDKSIYPLPPSADRSTCRRDHPEGRIF